MCPNQGFLNYGLMDCLSVWHRFSVLGMGRAGDGHREEREGESFGLINLLKEPLKSDRTDEFSSLISVFIGIVSLEDLLSNIRQ